MGILIGILFTSLPLFFIAFGIVVLMLAVQALIILDKLFKKGFSVAATRSTSNKILFQSFTGMVVEGEPHISIFFTNKEKQEKIIALYDPDKPEKFMIADEVSFIRKFCFFAIMIAVVCVVAGVLFIL